MDIAPVPTHPAPALAPAAGAPPRSVFVAVALGWTIPGFGQLYVRRPGKALLMLVAIGGLFYAGLRMSGFTCVNPSAYQLEFIAHAFLGGPTAAAYYLTRDVQLTELMPYLEAGRLYAAVAGLLNIVAIGDAVGEVLEHNKHSRKQQQERQDWLVAQQREYEARVAEAAEAEARAAAPGEAAAEPEPVDEGSFLPPSFLDEEEPR